MTTNIIEDYVPLMNELTTKVGVLRMLVRDRRDSYGCLHCSTDEKLEMLLHYLECTLKYSNTHTPNDIRLGLNNLREIYDDVLNNGLIDKETTLKFSEEMKAFESLII